MEITFRKELYGENKDNILAVHINSFNNETFNCYYLHGEVIKQKEYLRSKTRVATVKEYLSLKTKLNNNGFEFDVVPTLKTT